MRLAPFWLFVYCTKCIANAGKSPPRKEAQRLTRYADSSDRLSMKYTNEKLRSLKYKYDPNRPMSREERQKFRDPFMRATHGHPDEEHETRIGRGRFKGMWRGTGRSNADYIVEKTEQRAKRYAERKAKERQQRFEEYQRTGKESVTKNSWFRKERYERASKADPNAIVQLRVPKRNTYQEDPLRRTNQQYLKEVREKERLRSRRRYTRYKAGKESQDLQRPDDNVGMSSQPAKEQLGKANPQSLSNANSDEYLDLSNFPDIFS